MKSKDRFVLDTTVLVSAVLIENSRPAEAFRKARQVGEIVLSLPAAEELNEVLGREKFSRYITREDRERFLAAAAAGLFGLSGWPVRFGRITRMHAGIPAP